uniref:ubiquitinyl hydrolase 1 n=1 Tax=Cyprinodon variegatus TaxID=28743 RepID=A0A3Q2CJN8_CYPVA
MGQLLWSEQDHPYAFGPGLTCSVLFCLQLYYSQNYHQKIRQDCANFMRANRCDFEPFVEGSFEKYLERLEDPKETVGQVEIKALSQLYRRCFLIYRYPGKPATVISENDFVDKVTLCCSINGHYDIIYGRSYPASAALCQSLLYELLYTRVFGVEGAELCQAMEAFRAGGRRYRNSPSVCSDVDVGYDAPEDRAHREDVEAGGAAEEGKVRIGRLSLPYKVLKSLDGDVYRNLEFDVWQDTCKEMQKTDYMVFAGRQYFLGDKCQVRLEPKGKYYNAFIQEVGTHSAAVTVFIEELGEKHLVPLTDLKPVNPVPAWNVAAPVRKGELDPESRGQRHQRHRYFRKSRGSNGMKGAELLMPPPVSYGGAVPSSLPPRFHSARFLNRQLIGPQLSYYHPTRRYYHDYDNYAFRSRRSRRHLVAVNKECQFGFPAEAVDESADMDPPVAYYQLEDSNEGVFPALPSSPPIGSSYRVQRASGALHPTSPPGNTLLCSSEEDQEDVSTLEDQISMTISAAAPWLVNELGEPVCSVVTQPSYSYDPNGSDLPRVEGPSMNPASPGSTPSGLYPDQTLPPPTLLHIPFEAPPPAGYLPAAPHPPLHHPPHHPPYHPCLPTSAHWGTLPTSGHAPRVYCPAPNPTHVVGYITAPHTPTHYIPPTM